MNTLLIVITGLSIAVAAAASFTAWRVVQAERRRTAARVAALAAAAGVDTRRNGATPVDGPGPSAAPDAPADVPSGLHEFLPAAPIATAATADAAAGSTAGAIFARTAADSGSAGRQHGLLAAAAAFGVVIVAGAGVLFVSGRTPGASAALARTPLELVALGHARTEGQLAVQGVVRNPVSASAVSPVLAEVRVFDIAGLVIATRSARIDAVNPGQEVPFSVPLGEMPAAARYRVSFTSEGSMLPHVDRRTNLPAAVTAEAR